MYGSILVPLDGSTFAENALPLALSIARRARASLQVMYVHSPMALVYPESTPLIDDSLIFHLKTHQRAYLDGVVQRLTGLSSVPVHCTLAEGNIADQILGQAEKSGTALVVMTTHGRGPLGRFWLGSVADELVRRLPMPLLLVRPAESAVDLACDATFRHVLLPLDGTALAEQMIEPAAALGRLMEADYMLLRVIKPILPLGAMPEGDSFGAMVESVQDRIEQVEGKLRQEAQDYLEQLAERLRGQSLHVRTQVAIEAQPAVAILDEAARSKVDLIALATHGRRGLSRLFLGSVADKVIRGTSLPVLLHRPLV